MKGKYIAAIVGAGLLGALSYNSGGPTEKECLLYQGHRVIEDTVYGVFDDKPFSERTGLSDLVVEHTNTEDFEALELGEKYMIESREPRFAGLPRLVSISSCD